MSDARTKRERFLPWAWSRSGVDLEILSASLDDQRPVALDPDRRLLELDERWERAELRIRVGLSPELRARVLPPEETTGLDVVLTLRCDATRLRTGLRLPLPSSTLEHSITLLRDDLSGTAELGAVLIRRSPAPQLRPGFAAAAHARLADARPWELRVDRQRTLGGVYLDIRYKSFRGDPVTPEAERGNLYRLEVDLEAPILWLNSDHPAVSAVLDAKGHVGRKALLRDVAFDSIVPLVWMQLFVRCASDLRRSGELAYPWQEAVMDAVARLLDTERLEGADLDDLPGLLSRLDGALQARHSVAGHLLRLIEEVG